MRARLNDLTFLLYRWCLYPLSVFVVCLLFPLAPRKVQWFFLAQKSRQRIHLPHKHSIWVHAASGEIEFAKSFLREARSRWPHHNLVVSYSSPSAVELLRNFPGIDAHFPLCLDFPWTCDRLVEQLQPEIFLIARTDLWPELLHQLQLRGVPSVLFSATGDAIAKSAAKNLFLSAALAKLTEIAVVTESDKRAMQELLPAKPLHAIGEPRLDQILFRQQGNSTHALKITSQLPSNRRVFLLASFWPADLHEIKKCWHQWKTTMPDFVWVWVPHEPSLKNLNELREFLSQTGTQPSQVTTWPGVTDSTQPSSSHDGGMASNAASEMNHLIIDQVGYLADLYRFADIAFVGGGFHHQVHSILEALAYGVPCLTGPLVGKNPEARRFRDALPGSQKWVRVCSDGEALWQAFQEETHLPDPQSRKNSIRNQIQAEAGATAALVACVDRLLSTRKKVHNSSTI